MAARTVSCTFKNASKLNLVRVAPGELDHGIWSAEGEAPERIPAGTTATFGSESNGFMTGTEGRVRYAIADTAGFIELYWDNPFIGSNEFTQTVGSPPPGFVPFDPMHPGGQYPHYDQIVDYSKGNDIAIEYRFVVAEETPAAPPEPPAAVTPSPEEARTAAVPASASTTVQCPPGFRKILYVGLSANSAATEMADLKKQLGANATSCSYIVLDTLLATRDRDAFVAKTPFLDKHRSALDALEAASDPVVTTIPKPQRLPNGTWAYPVKTTNVDPALRTQMIRALAAVLGPAESDPLAVRRLVISGHHSAGWTNGRDDVFWGSAGHEGEAYNILTVLGDAGVLQGLSKIFPKAFAQVEDICFSACHTGIRDYDCVGKYIFKVFPNLSTAWTYEFTSPNASNPGTSITISSNTAILRWETASAPSGAADAINEASKKLRKAFPGVDNHMSTGASIVYQRGGAMPTK